MTVNSMDTSINTSNTASLYNQTATKLTNREKEYDLDNDGVLSSTEKAAMLEAVKSKTSSESDSVSISKEGFKMHMQNRPEPPMDVTEMSDDELKQMLSDIKDKIGQLPKELSDYSDTEISDLTDEDLSSIRETMADMQEKMQERMKEKMNGDVQTNEQRRIREAISEYEKYGMGSFVGANA